MEYKNIDFCVVSPVNNGYNKLMVFFTLHGAAKVTEDVWYSKEYPGLKSLVENLGFTEVDFGVFESTANSCGYNYLFESLSKAGLNFSEKLECSVWKELIKVSEVMATYQLTQIEDYMLN